MHAWSWEDLRATATLLEDEAVLALNKPAGISVMGERHETDIVGLASDAGVQLFPVHRIDKVTSGIVLFAKSLPVHGHLTRQFNKRTVDKRYLIITRTTGLPETGTIDLPLSEGRKGTARIGAPRSSIRHDDNRGLWWVAPQDLLSKKTYPSLTRFATVWSDHDYSLLVAKPITGRRHQLRVHFAWIGHPILGDPLFDKAADPLHPRTYLHSWRLGIDAAWRSGSRLEIEAPAGGDFWRPVADQLPQAALQSLS